jgi:hypothetical protein
MKPMTPNDAVRSLRFAMVGVSILGVGLALGPFSVPDGVDKLVHAGCFYAYTLVALACWPAHRKADIALAVIALGALSEAAQGVCGRDASAGDLVADALGVMLAAGPLWVARFRQLAQQHRFTPFAVLKQNDRRRRGARQPARQPVKAVRVRAQA